MKKHVEGKKSLWKMGCLATMSLLWLLVRTGGKPSRITYPCQKAAVANINIFLLALFAPVLAFGRFKTALPHVLDSRLTTTVLLVSSLLLAFGSIAFTGNYVSIQNSSVPVPLDLQTHNAVSLVNSSDLFFVENASGIGGDMDYAVASLSQLMGDHGLFFFKTADHPSGLIGKDDVVILKVNSQWDRRGGTNTDLVKSIIKKVVSHPEGFTGEIVIADNGQWMDRTDQSQWYTVINAYDHSQSMVVVANSFPSYKVSTWLWDIVRKNAVNEYIQGDFTDGYIVNQTQNPVTHFYVSYPKFKTKYGTYISLKNGIWNNATGSYDSGRLKIINIPVLKSHSAFGVTGCIKHYMGVLSNSLTDGHDAIADGAMGTEMAETRFPTLNILDAIWVNANPIENGVDSCGPDTNYEEASYTNVIGASLDPVALDYWGAKYILMPAAQAKGYTSYSSLDPDYAPIVSSETESFHNYLLRSMNELKNHGFQVTMTKSQMNVYVSSSAQQFSDNFESGTLGAWTTAYGGGGSAPTVQSITKNAGTYAAKCSITSAGTTSAGSYSIGVKDLGTTYPTLYLRAYIRFSATPTVGNYLLTNPDIMDAAENDVACAVIQNDNGTLKWGLRYCTDATTNIALDTTGKSVTANTWYYIEVMATTGAGTGKAALSINGTKIIEVTGLPNLSHPLRKIQFGVYSPTALTADVYTDDVVASTSYSEAARYGDVQPPFGTIDMKDVSYVAKRFNCFPGDALWDANADFNGDGRIDMKDIALPAKNFGVSY